MYACPYCKSSINTSKGPTRRFCKGCARSFRIEDALPSADPKPTKRVETERVLQSSTERPKPVEPRQFMPQSGKGGFKKSSLFYYDEADSTELAKHIRKAAQLFPAIAPSGYALRKGRTEGRRVLTAMLSDLHYGSDLDKREHLLAYSNVEECRATAKVLYNVLEYKTDKRDETTLDIDINGDEFAGLLGHDDKAVAPLTFQLLRSAHLLAQFIRHSSAAFPSVRVTKTPGNHGRNLLRHYGRADNQKWDNFETLMFQLVRGLCRDLPNVEWIITPRAWVINRVFGWNKFITHGDTEGNFKPGSPAFEKWVSSINASPYYGGYIKDGGRIDIVELGHWHSGQHFTVNHTEVFVNPALIPPDGHSASGNYLTACGQFLFESTERYAVGDTRKVRINTDDYTSTEYDGLLQPWSEDLMFTDVEKK